MNTPSTSLPDGRYRWLEIKLCGSRNSVMSHLKLAIAIVVAFVFATPIKCVAQSSHVVTLNIHNFSRQPVRVLVSSFTGNEKHDFQACSDGYQDSWAIEISKGQKVISTFDMDGNLLCSFPVNIQSTEKHIPTLLFFDARMNTWSPHISLPQHVNPPEEKRFCNGFSEKKNCVP